MLFWTLVGLTVLAVVFCTAVAIVMIRATRDNEW